MVTVSMEPACALCQEKKQLEESHIIPKFVVRHIKKTSTGFLRGAEQPDLRVEDGTKIRLLCRACEALFSGWERDFANRVFHPFHGNPTKHIETYPHEAWAMKFAVSVVWRVLRWHQTLDSVEAHFDPDVLKLVERAEERWAQFLRGEVPHPGDFQLHLLLLGRAEWARAGTSTRLTRYTERSVDAGIPTGGGYTMVYAKLARILVFGLIEPPRMKREWRGTKLRVGRGVLGSMRTCLPEPVWRYVNEQATRSGKLRADMSEKQRRKIRVEAELDRDGYLASESYDALKHDLSLFGSEERGNE